MTVTIAVAARYTYHCTLHDAIVGQTPMTLRCAITEVFSIPVSVDAGNSSIGLPQSLDFDSRRPRNEHRLFSSGNRQYGRMCGIRQTSVIIEGDRPEPNFPALSL